jgi:hypothetical protein
MAEGSVAQIMAERYRLGKVFVERERAGYYSSYLADLNGVGKPVAIMVALRAQKDLRLVDEASERFRVDDTVPVALVACA